MNHSLRAIIAALAGALAMGPAFAIQGDPVPGADVSAEQSPSGIIMPAAKCKPPLGTLSHRADGKWICTLTPVRTLKPINTLKPAAMPAAHTAPAGVSAH